VPARLKLFLQVARAVAHAHAQLVVHRDLKPANILVTETGEVRLLDFGIAKLLEDGQANETELTQMAGRALTPEYAAPEQILGQPIATSADVYALGVVLFELLTGQRPYKLKRDSRAALEEAIVAAEVQRPSSVAADAKIRKRLHGDLDTIVLKALKKAPAERYRSVEALAEDIERHLALRPVLAQPESRTYRLRKFVARNRLAVGATASVLIAIVAGAGAALWQAREAQNEQKRAEEVKEFITTIFKDANPFQQGSGKALTGVELLRLAKDKLDRVPLARPATRVELQTLLGSSLISLEDATTAEAVLLKAVDESTASFGPMHGLTLRARGWLAEAYRAQERPDDARQLVEQMLPTLRHRQARQPGDLTAALLVLANVAAKQTRLDEAEALATEGLAVVRQHMGGLGPEHVALLGLLASVHRVAGRTEKSLDFAQQAYAAAQRLHADQARHPTVVDARYMVAFVLADNGKAHESVQEFRAVLSDTAMLLGDNSRRLGTRLGASAEMFSEAGHMTEAIANTERAHRILSGFAPPESRLMVAVTEAVGLAYLGARRGAVAAPHLGAALDGYRKLFGADNFTVLVTQRNRSLALTYAGQLAAAERDMAQVLAKMPRIARDGYDANAWIAGMRERLAERFDAALQLQQRALDSLPDQPSITLPRARALTELGLNEIALGHMDAARATLRSALALYEGRAVQLLPEHADALIGLARIELAAGDVAAALLSLERADGFWREFDPDSRWAGEAAYWLSEALHANGRHAAAREAYGRAVPILARSPFPSDARLLKLARR